MEKEKKTPLEFQPTNKSFMRLGLTLLCVVAICCLLALILFNVSGLKSIVGKLLTVVEPILYGILFAYLMNPVMMLVEGLLTKWFAKGNMPERSVKRLSRGISIAAAAIVLVAIVYAVAALVVPQVIESVEDLINNKLNDYYNRATAWIESFVSQNDTLNEWYETNKAKIDILGYIKNWFEKIDIAQFFTDAIGTVVGFAKSLMNVLLGFVVAIYMLISKERFQSQAKKLTVAIFKPKHADRLFELARRTNRLFGGFIIGKLIDSLIIGVLCYIIMLILRLPYAMLISTLVGITNIIPFFGPLIGVSCGTFLILLADPLQALTFLICGIVLQQVDGNIIGPRILGDRMGISDFWILVSITVFGGLFGFAGMLLGVPVFAVLYSFASDAVNSKLRKKSQPTATNSYYSILSVSDLKQYQTEFEHSTVFHSEDTFDTQYEPEDDIEFDDMDEMDDIDDMNDDIS